MSWAQRSLQNHHQMFHARCPEKIVSYLILSYLTDYYLNQFWIIFKGVLRLSGIYLIAISQEVPINYNVFLQLVFFQLTQQTKNSSDHWKLETMHSLWEVSSAHLHRWKVTGSLLNSWLEASSLPSRSLKVPEAHSLTYQHGSGWYP